MVYPRADTESDRAVRGFPEVRPLATEAPLWPGAARNLGARCAGADDLAFLDADCQPSATWLRAAAEALASGARVATGPLTHTADCNSIAVADNLLQFIDFAGFRPEGLAPYAPGCNWAMRRTDFEALGGFPEHTPVGEDTLLSRQALAAWPDGIRYRPPMAVAHRGRGTLRGLWAHQRSFGYYRGLHGLALRPLYRRWGCRRAGAVLLAMGRWPYLLKSCLWRDPRLFALLLGLSPLVLAGLAGWGAGLRAGCRTAIGRKP